ncbi:hypothetical protein SAMD00019534_009660 [Acytostelium subglobosum LB1]|uniref:hypothetical protein n=1 Tax=Acytostelium subglobosum LB1 TaxID=1410327 RepID=UPI000644A1C2|nr:hypothetical protein SAMD00019534_009660 [Acytostelium subglobosum LB1]GAM17791.1 hypothetical protein SAMD00019534_009660 [Acytostelium subglobosum LB1]|eukprot:XP_012758387.1 hypothetical protein SAMD00019534_009660 [Acytostelium subglobosum LB1]
MIKYIFVSLVLSLVLVNAIKVQLSTGTQGFNRHPSPFIPGLNNAGGGYTCVTCTLILSVVEQYSLIHEKSVDAAMDDICGFLPGEMSKLCTYMVSIYGNEIVQYFAEVQHADDVCHKLNNVTADVQPSPLVSGLHKGKVHPHPSKVNESPLDWFKDLINRFSKDHSPLEDVDGDKFSDEITFRGYNWRGRDCDDLNNQVYPGSKYNNPNAGPYTDWNCNGIKGLNSTSNIGYEDELCGNSGPMGVIVVGDSAGAHFSIPPQWLTASEINSTTYNGMIEIIANEMDWPQRSTYTGWNPSTNEVPVDSIYLRMRERNLCNHRDYQNTAVNGADSHDVAFGLAQTIARNQETDAPVLLFLELIGNDVCSSHHDFDHMTTVDEFTTNTLTTLQYLDTVLPSGSHVVFVGLADGRVLWNSLWNRTHPIGATYEQVYDFLNCLDTSPCWGWMNPNETVRDFTSERAANLSLVYNQIIASHTYQHFDMQYYDFPFDAINAEWIAQGGQTWQLIEPVDGFHPNQIANYLIAGYFWDQLTQDHPEWLGSINPNNQLIQQMFGDQGGYN